MPGPLAPVLIAAGAQLAGTGANAISQGSMNRKTRKFAQKQALQQRQWALDDWAMQNAYNHPSAQMARLREAGLNPNLVYGNGADTTSGPVRSSESAQWNPRAPEYDLGSAASAGLSAYYDVQIKQAQIDNLTTQNTVMLEDIALKKAQAIATLAGANKTGLDIRSGEFDLAMKTMLKDISAEAASVDLQKKKADLSYTLNQTEIAIAQNASSLKEAAERILRSRAERSKIPAEKMLIQAQIKNLEKDGSIKQLDIDLKEKGVQPTDNLFFRVLGRLLEPGNAKEIRDKYGLKLSDKFKKWDMNPIRLGK